MLRRDEETARARAGRSRAGALSLLVLGSVGLAVGCTITTLVGYTGEETDAGAWGSGGSGAVDGGADKDDAADASDAADDDSADGDAGPSCEQTIWGQFTVLDYFNGDNASPPGCSTSDAPGDPPAAALQGWAQITKWDDPYDVQMTFSVRRADGAVFPNGKLRLYVGLGPACSKPANVGKAEKEAVLGITQQSITLDLSKIYSAQPGDEVPPWYLMEIKQFWIGFESYVDGSISASSMVKIQRRCIP